MNKSCQNCRLHRNVDGALRCEEPRSKSVGRVIVLDVLYSKMAGSFERVCTLVAARCSFYQTLT
ncbi:MAG TPA: hypothetical protein VKE95_20510 [Burkholderiales bacterium]|nr:hypothetical protein [Burkholderiales bacterium]